MIKFRKKYMLYDNKICNNNSFLLEVSSSVGIVGSPIKKSFIKKGHKQ